MTRIAILDHENHTLMIQDITDEELAKYDGSEQAYIEDNYTLEGEYSWDYITGIEYFPQGQSEPIDLEPTDII